MNYHTRARGGLEANSGQRCDRISSSHATRMAVVSCETSCPCRHIQRVRKAVTDKARVRARMGDVQHRLPDLCWPSITNTGDLNEPACGDHDIGQGCSREGGGPSLESVDRTRIWRNLNLKVAAPVSRLTVFMYNSITIGVRALTFYLTIVVAVRVPAPRGPTLPFRTCLIWKNAPYIEAPRRIVCDLTPEM